AVAAFVGCVRACYAAHSIALCARRRRRDASVLKPRFSRGIGSGGTLGPCPGLYDHGPSHGLRSGAQHRRSDDRLSELALEFLPAGSHRLMRYVADTCELETSIRALPAP